MTEIKDFLLSKKNIVIISLIIILLIGIISFIAFNGKFFIKKKKNTNIIKERILVNSGDNHETVIYYANMPWASEPIYMTLNDEFRKR